MNGYGNWIFTDATIVLLVCPLIIIGPSFLQKNQNIIHNKNFRLVNIQVVLERDLIIW